MSEPAPAPAAFEPLSLLGTVLDGRYEIVGHLATGGMGAVFRARHVHLRKEVAVKVLRPDLTSSPEIVERFRREAEIASALEHDNIVRVSDFGRTREGFLFLAMELLTGESLFDRLRREGFLPPEEAVPILWQVCAGLEAAHARGVVHRDLKPENVFLARTGSGREVTKILDFGIAKIADSASGSATQAGIVVGTPEYLSPEQAMGSAVDARADVYAVGLIAWRTLAGRHPFKADDARSLLMMQATRPVPPLTEPRPDLAAWPGLVAAIAKACAKDASARHQTAAALREDLAAALGPAFLMPPGATPAPAISVTLSPLPLPLPFPRPSRPDVAAPPAGATLPAEPQLSPSPARAAGLAWGRARLAAIRALRSARDRAVRAARRAVALARANPAPAAAVALAVVAAIAAALALGWERGRAAAEVRALLEEEQPAAARRVAEDALRRRPDDRELLLLRARALSRIPGASADAMDAYAAARAAGGPLDGEAHADLVAALGRDRTVADKATRLLQQEGEAVLPAVLRAAGEGRGLLRLRALALARELGAESDLDRVAAYGELLAEPECEVRRAAARRLGEIGDPAALPRLHRAAQARVESKGFFGTRTAPACGAAEADAAARRIEAAQLSPGGAE